MLIGIVVMGRVGVFSDVQIKPQSVNLGLQGVTFTSVPALPPGLMPGLHYILALSLPQLQWVSTRAFKHRFW